MHSLRTFLQSEHGAVTVDWVVLTAAVVGLGIATVTAVRSGTNSLAGDVSTSLSGAEVASLACLGDAGGPAGFACYNGPTITAATNAYGFGMGGACMMAPDGGVTCGPSTMTMVEIFAMSDGSTYNKQTYTVQGQDPVITWTDGAGNAVDAPPPMT